MEREMQHDKMRKPNCTIDKAGHSSSVLVIKETKSFGLWHKNARIKNLTTVGLIMTILLLVVLTPKAGFAEEVDNETLHKIKTSLDIVDLSDATVRYALNLQRIPSTPYISLAKDALNIYTIGNCIYHRDYDCSLKTSTNWLVSSIWQEIGLPGVGTMITAVELGIKAAEAFVSNVNDSVIAGKCNMYFSLRQQGESDSLGRKQQGQPLTFEFWLGLMKRNCNKPYNYG